MENSNFIRTIIENDVKSGKHDTIITRFPPEPNGFLHLGHARAIIMNHTLAHDYGGYFNLRFDDTNPVKEDTMYVEAIKKDIAWLGCHWKNLYFASDYFDEMYFRAMRLVEKGLAYVCDLSAEQIKDTRGDLTNSGVGSPYRNRSIEENIALFKAMKNGEFADGAKVLRAKIDMSSPNMNMRDPVVYRIQRATHHNTQDKWCIYPMYDFAHPLEDAIEGITHSLCSLEFEDHRPLYDWFVKHTEMENVPRQIEFGKLRIANQISGKRYIKQLVDEGHVDGWDDPRLITLSGLRRRGVPPQAIHQFIHALGLPKSEGDTDLNMLDEAIRDVLKISAKRIHAVIDPIHIEITNYPDNAFETLIAPFNKDNESLGDRPLHFSRHLLIERDDFMRQKPNKKYKRLALGEEVRLMHAYFIKANDVKYDDAGCIETVYCTYDPQTKSGSGFTDRKPNGTIHFVEKTQAQAVEIRLYEPLVLNTDQKDIPVHEKINSNSRVIKQGFIEASVPLKPNESYQFTRIGYFSVDADNPAILHRIVALKSSFK